MARLHAASNVLRQVELLHQVRLRSMNTRIKFDGERLPQRLASRAQLQRVVAGHNQRPLRLHSRSLFLNRVVRQGVFGVVQQLAPVTVRKRERRRITKVPGEAIHARSFGQNGWRRKPVIGRVRGKEIRRLRIAGELSYLAALIVVDGQGEFILRRRFQEVVEDSAIGRVLARRCFARIRRVLISVPSHAHRGGRTKQVSVAGGDLLAHLAQRRDVVEDPQGASEGRDRDVVAMHCEIGHRRGRQG